MANHFSQKFDLNDSDLISVIDELPLWSAPFGLKLLDNIILRKNLTAVDIGTGFGFPIIEVAQRLGSTSKVYGIDPWLAAVERAKKKLGLYLVSNVELIVGRAEEMPFVTASVDLIFSNNGINNVDDLDQVLAECGRIAKSGCQFIQTVNLDETMHEFYSEFESVLANHGMNDEIEKMRVHIYEKRRPQSELIEKITNQGFSPQKIENDSFLFRYVDGTTMLKHFFIRFAFLESWQKLIESDKQTGIFSELEEHLNKIAEKKGELQLTIPFVLLDFRRN